MGRNWILWKGLKKQIQFYSYSIGKPVFKEKNLLLMISQYDSAALRRIVLKMNVSDSREAIGHHYCAPGKW